MRKQIPILSVLPVLALGFAVFAQQPAKKEPTLLFREDFKAGPAGQVQFTQELWRIRIWSSKFTDLVRNRSRQSVRPPVGQRSRRTRRKMMSILYTGVVQGNWAVMLRDKNNYLDLRDTGRFRWRLRQRSLHQLHPLIKLADGTLLVGDYEEPLASYMRESELYLFDVPAGGL